LFGPSRTLSLGENYYALVIVDNFSTFIVTEKDSFFQHSKSLPRFYKLIIATAFAQLEATMEEISK